VDVAVVVITTGNVDVNVVDGCVTIVRNGLVDLVVINWPEPEDKLEVDE
jgi:hypothetical protein